MSRPRDPICPRCGVRPKLQRQSYCRECRAVLSLEWYHKKHPEAKRHDQAAAEKRKLRAEEEARTADRRRRLRELEAWCRAEGIRELVRRMK